MTAATPSFAQPTDPDAEQPVSDAQPEVLTVDLATDTGDFHGGASGSLYGLYGPELPTSNVVEGMHLRTVATKGQDGAQHPGSDALEVLPTLADATGGDVYVRTTDYYRGFPYEWPGDTPEERLSGYEEVMAEQLDQIATLDPEYLDHIVIEPFNEPEGNMFGDGEWSYNGTSWLEDPTDYFAAWDNAYELIREKLGDVRISGPNTSVLFSEVEGFLEHTVEQGTVPDVITWHELSHPEQIRESVVRYRGWEEEVFSGTELEGTELPINLNEYAHNFHTSVPGQMVQWVSAIEESKVDAMVAFWNINGNNSDSVVESNRGNGQWWLFNTYGSMTGNTVEVSPPQPGEDYTLQGVATLDVEQARAQALVGGADGAAEVRFDNVPEDVFGSQVHAWVREIPWSGQIGDSAPPTLLSEEVLEVQDSTVAFDFGDALPGMRESSAYEVVLTPVGEDTGTAEPPVQWEGSYEAENAAHSGDHYNLIGPEGSPDELERYYTSGDYHVGGFSDGSDLQLDFTVDVPETGTYDLRVFGNSYYLDEAIEEQGPTNVFLTADDGEEQELHLPLAYNDVVWDHVGTSVDLTEGENTLTLAAESSDGNGTTQGNATVDRVTLELSGSGTDTVSYEAELADLHGATTVHTDERLSGAEVSGSGAVELETGDEVDFWVYAEEGREHVIDVHALGSGAADLAVNDYAVGGVGTETTSFPVSLEGGINKVTLTGTEGTPLVDRIDVTPSSDEHLVSTVHQAEDATTEGEAAVTELPLSDTGQAVTGIGGELGNSNNLTFDVDVSDAGTYAMRVRYSNPETSPPSHYNPNPMARQADIAVNGAAAESVLFFPPTYHENNFWEMTVPVELEGGANTVVFASEEQPNFDGETYASDTWPDYLLRSEYGPVIDNITISELSGDSL